MTSISGFMINTSNFIKQVIHIPQWTLRYNVKKYSGSSMGLESIGLEFSWVVHGGRASVITWKKFQSGGECSRCWVRVALRGVPGLRNRPANQPITYLCCGCLPIAWPYQNLGGPIEPRQHASAKLRAIFKY